MIRLSHVHKAFGSRRVLIDYELEVPKGETFVMLGPSGIGKSVTLKHVIGLLQPDEGEVLVDGIEVSSGRPKELAEVRSRMGYLFQSGALLNWMSLADNVALPLREGHRREKLSKAQIDAAVEEKLAMVQLETEMHKLPSEISGGMRKRAALARVLATDPSIILYDEPTAGLDPRMAATISKLINDVAARFHCTAIVVTHDLHCAFAVADRLGMMHLGRLVEVGTPDEFRQTKNPVVRDFLDGKPLQSVDEETRMGHYQP